jgi:hypothetical protein
MKTSNHNLEPVIYQYRFEHPNNSFGTMDHPQTPHLMEMRQSSKNRHLDSENFKKVFLTKVGILLFCAATFTILSLVF